MDPLTLAQFFSTKQPRHLKVIENVLLGHKTVSNLYWGLQYHLLNYLGIWKNFDVQAASKSIQVLVEKGILKPVNNYDYLLTQKSLHSRWPLEWERTTRLNLDYDIQRFRDRFLLAVQVASEYSYRNRNYYPLQINEEDAKVVKLWFHQFKHAQLNFQFFQKLKLFLKAVALRQPKTAWQMTNVLIGHHHPGLTNEQMARVLKVTPQFLQLREFQFWCLFFSWILRRQDSFFKPLTMGLTITPLSPSARFTYQLAKQNYSFAQISQRRHLKPSTIKEHLLTVAIFEQKHFPFANFLPVALIHQMRQVFQGNPNHWHFNDFEMQTKRPLDFFYFRLYQIERSLSDE